MTIVSWHWFGEIKYVSVPTHCQQQEHCVSINESTNKHAQKRNTQADLGDIDLGCSLALTHDHDPGCPSTKIWAPCEQPFSLASTALGNHPLLAAFWRRVLQFSFMTPSLWVLGHYFLPSMTFPSGSFFKDCLLHLIPFTHWICFY